MLTLQRQDEILTALRRDKTLKVATLAQKLYVSEATIRRDLAAMERLGLLRRSRGGAISAEPTGGEVSLLVRMQQSAKEKRRIAELALPLVRDSKSMFLDSSSTVCALARLLHTGKRTVVTNGLQTALELAEYPDVNVILPGGTVRGSTHSVTGETTLRELGNIRVDVCCVSCGGLDPLGGATENTIEQCTVKAEMLTRSRTKILLCDAGKFGKINMFRTAPLDAFDYIVTDREPSEQFRRALPSSVRCLYFL